jgi:hypothetical protein
MLDKSKILRYLHQVSQTRAVIKHEGKLYLATLSVSSQLQEDGTYDYASLEELPMPIELVDITMPVEWVFIRE